MANEIIRPTQLPARADPVASEVVPSDNGATVGGVTWVDGVNAAVPPASQPESEAGVINTKRMTPLTTKQAIDAQVPPLISGAIGGLGLDTMSQESANDYTKTAGLASVALSNDYADLSNRPTLGTAAATDAAAYATAAQGALADTAVQPSRTVSTGAGLTGGGTLATDQTIALNSASIASLAKADTSVQTVNGNSPDGAGNVVVDAEFTQEQDSRATAILATFAPTVEWVRTAGHASAGDGGGALYRRVLSQPSHAGKFQSADGAWWEIDMRNGVNVLQFGAKGDGTGNDAPFIQNSIDAMSTVGGDVIIPRGVYLLASGISVVQKTSDWHDTKRVNLLGAGSGLTRLRYTGPVIAAPVVDWSTDASGDVDGTYGNSWARIGGFLIEGNNAAYTGLRILAKSWFEADDIRILGAVERNFMFISTVSWSGRSLRSYGSKVGMSFSLGGDPLSYSIPNNITLLDATIGNATEWGVHARNSGPINFVGGSLEGNGTHGVDGSGGAYFITNDAGIGVEGAAFNFYGTYFEGNRGGADVYMSQQSATFPRVGNFHGVNFNRVHAIGYTNNNVRVELLGSARARANLYGCGFSYGGDYSPSAVRRCLDITGDVSQGAIHYDGATTFRSSVDGPNNLDGPWNAPQAMVFASLRCNPDGTPLRRRNILSVSKTAVGRYTVQFKYPARSGNPQAISSIVGGFGMASIVGESASSVSIATKDHNGVDVDAAFNLAVFDAL